MNSQCPTSARTTPTMIGSGTNGGLSRTAAASHPGAAPPGVGSTSSASPSQTNEAPSVTTIDGSRRASMNAPMAA